MSDVTENLQCACTKCMNRIIKSLREQINSLDYMFTIHADGKYRDGWADATISPGHNPIKECSNCPREYPDHPLPPKKVYKLAEMYKCWMDDEGLIEQDSVYHQTLESAQEWAEKNPYIIAITKTDAVSFYEGEGLKRDKK